MQISIIFDLFFQNAISQPWFRFFGISLGGLLQWQVTAEIHGTASWSLNMHVWPLQVQRYIPLQVQRYIPSEVIVTHVALATTALLHHAFTCNVQYNTLRITWLVQTPQISMQLPLHQRDAAYMHVFMHRQKTQLHTQNLNQLWLNFQALAE